MNINKVEWYADPIIDLTQDTISSEHLLIGETAHQSNGDIIIGEASPKFTTGRRYISLSPEITLAPGECTTTTISSTVSSSNAITMCVSNIWVISKTATSVTAGTLNVDCHIVRTTQSSDGNDGLYKHYMLVSLRNLEKETVTFNRIYYMGLVIQGKDRWIKAYE